MAEYDAFAADFHATRNRPWPEFELLKQYIKPKAKVLDVGCGNGRLRHYLPNEVIYTGMDISEKLIKIAQKEHPNASFVQHDFVNIWPQEMTHFDVIVGIASYHHILSKAQQQQFLENALAALQPGGILFLTTWKLPQKHRIANWTRGRFVNWNVPFQGHKRIYRKTSARTLRSDLKRAGFSVLRADCPFGRNFVAVGQKPS